jgi:hypothetical protein
VKLLAFLLPAVVASAQPRITIEKATIAWSELERLLGREATQPLARPRRSAPLAYAIPKMDVRGDVEAGQTHLHFSIELQVLPDRWTLAPLFPSELSVSRAAVLTPEDKRGLLVRTGSAIALAAEGSGTYELEIDAEGSLSLGGLKIAPAGLTGGTAELLMRGVERLDGEGWKIATAESGEMVANRALGLEGLSIRLPPIPAPESAGAGLEELEAVTVVTLGGAGVTRMSVLATPDASGELLVELPANAQLWKIFVGSSVLDLPKSSMLRVPLKKQARVEIAYTFASQPLGIRGRFHVELPSLKVPVREASWELWLPGGLEYSRPQAALIPAACGEAHMRAHTRISLAGKCFGFARPVLEPGRPYIEAVYDQPLH